MKYWKEFHYFPETLLGYPLLVRWQSFEDGYNGEWQYHVAYVYKGKNCYDFDPCHGFRKMPYPDEWCKIPGYDYGVNNEN